VRSYVDVRWAQGFWFVALGAKVDQLHRAHRFDGANHYFQYMLSSIDAHRQIYSNACAATQITHSQTVPYGGRQDARLEPKYTQTNVSGVQPLRAARSNDQTHHWMELTKMVLNPIQKQRQGVVTLLTPGNSVPPRRPQGRSQSCC
jgi:hypothetical protein